jgi:hypothetical protein
MTSKNSGDILGLPSQPLINRVERYEPTKFYQAGTLVAYPDGTCKVMLPTGEFVTVTREELATEVIPEVSHDITMLKPVMARWEILYTIDSPRYRNYSNTFEFMYAYIEGCDVQMKDVIRVAKKALIEVAGVNFDPEYIKILDLRRKE